MAPPKIQGAAGTRHADVQPVAPAAGSLNYATHFAEFQKIYKKLEF